MHNVKIVVYLYGNQITTKTSNIMSLAFESVKNTAENRSTEMLKEDAIVAYKNMKANNSDATKIVYHAIFEVLMGRMSESELDDFESSYKN